jgi:hypothetical protein
LLQLPPQGLAGLPFEPEGLAQLLVLAPVAVGVGDTITEALVVLGQLLMALHLSLVGTLQNIGLLVALAISSRLLLLRSQDLVFRLQGLDPRLQTKGGAILALEDVFVLGDEGQQASLSLAVIEGLFFTLAGIIAQHPCAALRHLGCALVFDDRDEPVAFRFAE